MQATTASANHNNICFPTIIAWILATVAGGIIGNALAGLFPPLMLIAMPVISSMTVGIAQGFMLQRFGVSLPRWIVITSLAGLLGCIAGGIGLIVGSGILAALDVLVIGSSHASVAARSATLGLMGGLVTGAIVGYAQRSLLPIASQHRGRWVLASAIGWPIGGAIQSAFIGIWIVDSSFLTLVGTTPLPLPIFLALVGACNWLATGILTSATLTWLLWTNQPRSNPAHY